MLARSAQGLYWMSRYLERTQHLCRLLRLQSEALVDRPISEIDFGWKRIYNSVGRYPPSGDNILLDSDDYVLADSYILADDFTFEPTNPDSVWSCFSLGRENARQMRRCISAEMWSCLNLAYLRVRSMSIQDVWRTSPESFYTEMTGEIDTFSGVTAATMYRDEGWLFVQLGHAVESAQLLSTLLLTQIDLDALREESSDTDWTSLLRMYNAFEAYNRQYSVAIEPDKVLDLLATDVLLPRSLFRSLRTAEEVIAAIGDGPDTHASDAAHGLAGRLTSMLQHEWKDGGNRRTMLGQMNSYCRELHELLNNAYFEYSSDKILRH